MNKQFFIFRRLRIPVIWLIICCVSIGFALGYLVNMYLPGHNKHVYSSMAAAVFFLITAWEFRKEYWRERFFVYRREKKGQIAGLLGRMSSDNTSFFHQLPTHCGVVDHFLVSNKGLYIIHTHTFGNSDESKRPPVTYIDGCLWFGKKQDPAGLREHLFECQERLQRRLKNQTHRPWPIIPVLFFPDCEVNSQTDITKTDMLVTNPKDFPAIYEEMLTLWKPKEFAELKPQLYDWVEELYRNPEEEKPLDQ